MTLSWPRLQLCLQVLLMVPLAEPSDLPLSLPLYLSVSHSLSLSLSLSLSTHTHTRTHARTHAHAHAHPHSLPHHEQVGQIVARLFAQKSDLEKEHVKKQCSVLVATLTTGEAPIMEKDHPAMQGLFKTRRSSAAPTAPNRIAAAVALQKEDRRRSGAPIRRCPGRPARRR